MVGLLMWLHISLGRCLEVSFILYDFKDETNKIQGSEWKKNNILGYSKKSQDHYAIFNFGEIT